MASPTPASDTTTASAATPVLEAVAIGKRFGGVTALDDVLDLCRAR